MHQEIIISDEFDTYFISDPHGEYDLLVDVLNEIQFKYPVSGIIRDRLFLIGDLIDRGKQSIAMLGAAQFNPAIISTVGNHEVLASKALSNGGASAIIWLYNGGEWRDQYDEYHLRSMIDYASKQPYAITLCIGEHKIGLAHASVCFHDWIEMIAVLENGTITKEQKEFIVSNRTDFKQGLEYQVSNIDAVLHGHNIVDNITPLVLGNRCYIDAGMSFGDRALILRYQSGGNILGMFESYSLRRDHLTGGFVWL